MNLCSRPLFAGQVGECRVRIGEINVRLRSDVPEALEDFNALYGESTHESGDDDGIEIDVRRSRRGWLRRQYEVAGDGQKLWTARRVREVLPYVEWGINWRVIARRNDFLQLHAATLAKDGQGLILAADSGAGKSTLAAGLLARGWKYLSDEFALIHPETLELHAFPKALCIKSGSFAVMERLGLPLWRRRHYVKALKGAVAYLRPADLGPEAVASPVPVNWIILPQYREGDRPRLYPMPRAQVAFALARYAFNRSVFGPKATRALATITRQASCWRLDCGALEDTCDTVESLSCAARAG